ncbi:hypothetical protein PHABIO_9 [Pseudomonas phage Phabio]|uniref:Uncharacterized protein n=1 Tax=Pseudomonas phage Phabio TaxID=2006668 RepID=A0A1Y0STK1_9CAUD|nr:hypothetical protein MZD05_gp009 [Pseudomonas phage Phabio]ARV76640.1 hypothetical protein PHABIO_9 [Pseudomonas phage Phabio]
MSKVIFIATLIGTASNNVSPTTETLRVDFTQGFDLMDKCRKFEQSYHVGNGSIVSRGNKLVSRYVVEGSKIVTLETMCLEQE